MTKTMGTKAALWVCLATTLGVFACGRAPEPAASPAGPAEPPSSTKSEDAEEEAAPEAAAEEPPAPEAAPSEAAPPEAAAAPADLSRESTSEPGAARSSESSYRASFAALSRALELADCSAAARHRDAICALAERICELTEGQPGSLRGSRCDEGKARCEDAKRRYAQRCG